MFNVTLPLSYQGFTVNLYPSQFVLAIFRSFCTKWLVPTEHASGSHVFYFRPSKVNSYKNTLHNLNYV